MLMTASSPITRTTRLSQVSQVGPIVSHISLSNLVFFETHSQEVCC